MIPFDGNPFGISRGNDRFLYGRSVSVKVDNPTLNVYGGYRLQQYTFMSPFAMNISGDIRCNTFTTGSNDFGTPGVLFTSGWFVAQLAPQTIYVESKATYIEANTVMIGSNLTGYTSGTFKSGAVTAVGFGNTTVVPSSNVANLLLGSKMTRCTNMTVTPASGTIPYVFANTNIQCCGDFTDSNIKLELEVVNLIGAPGATIKCMPKLTRSAISLTKMAFPIKLFGGEYGIIDCRDEYTDGSSVTNMTVGAPVFKLATSGRGVATVDVFHYKWFGVTVQADANIRIKTLHVYDKTFEFYGCNVDTAYVYGNTVAYSNAATSNVLDYYMLAGLDSSVPTVPHTMRVERAHTSLKELSVGEGRKNYNIGRLIFEDSNGDNLLSLTSGYPANLIAIDEIVNCQSLLMVSGSYEKIGPAPGLRLLEIVPVGRRLSYQVPSGLELVTIQPVTGNNYFYDSASTFLQLATGATFKVYATPYLSGTSYSFQSIPKGIVVNFKIDITAKETMTAYILAFSSTGHDPTLDKYFFAYNGVDVEIIPNQEYSWGRLAVSATTVRLYLTSAFTA